MRTLIALALLTSSASAALVNSQPAGAGWLKLNLPTPLAIDHYWYGWPTGEYFTGSVQAANPGAASLWTNAPLVTLWTAIFHVQIPNHDFSPEFAAGLNAVNVAFGRVIRGTVRDELGESLKSVEVTYTGAGGYSRTATLRAFYVPEPGAGGMMLACALGVLSQRLRQPRQHLQHGINAEANHRPNRPEL